MGHSDYPLQALLYATVLHRFLRWRLPGYDPEQHLGEVLYLYVRGMCGPATPAGRRGRRAACSPGRHRCRSSTTSPTSSPGGWRLDDRAVRADRRARLAAGPRAQRRAGRSAGRLQRRAAADGRRPPRRLHGWGRSAARTTSSSCWRSRPRFAPYAVGPCASRSTTCAAEAPELPWPDAAVWADAVRRSSLVEQGVLRVGLGSRAGGCSTSTAITGWRRRYVTTWSPACSNRRPRSTRRGSPGSDREGARTSTPATSRSRPPSPLSADGRRSSPAGRAPARPPRWRGCWPCWPTRRWHEANACRSLSAPRPARPPAGCRRP